MVELKHSQATGAMSCRPVVASQLKIPGTGEPSPGFKYVHSRNLGLCNKLGRNTGTLNQRTQDWETDD